MSDYQEAGLKHPDAPCNQPDDDGIRECMGCGESYKTDKDELRECHEHFFEMDKENQEEELHVLVGERNALRVKYEELRSRCTYKEAELRELREGLDGLLAMFPKKGDTDGRGNGK